MRLAQEYIPFVVLGAWVLIGLVVVLAWLLLRR